MGRGSPISSCRMKQRRKFYIKNVKRYLFIYIAAFQRVCVMKMPYIWRMHQRDTRRECRSRLCRGRKIRRARRVESDLAVPQPSRSLEKARPFLAAGGPRFRCPTPNHSLQYHTAWPSGPRLGQAFQHSTEAIPAICSWYGILP